MRLPRGNDASSIRRVTQAWASAQMQRLFFAVTPGLVPSVVFRYAASRPREAPSQSKHRMVETPSQASTWTPLGGGFAIFGEGGVRKGPPISLQEYRPLESIRRAVVVFAEDALQQQDLSELRLAVSSATDDFKAHEGWKR